MARTSRTVVQIDRLRDQVYALIRDDLKSGDFLPGQRLVELELAEKYGVSRTPVREALFQLSREGLLNETDRGYTTPVFTKRDIFDRLEVKRLLGLRLAAYVAEGAKTADIKLMSKHHREEKDAHEANNIQAFNIANQQFRTQYYMMCENLLLSRCAMLVDDQFQIARNRIHEIAENREKTIYHDERLLAAVNAHDSAAASAEIESFLDFLAVYYAKQMA